MKKQLDLAGAWVQVMALLCASLSASPALAGGGMPLLESRAYMICRASIAKRSMDPDRAVVPGIHSDKSEGASFRFVWKGGASRVALPSMWGGLRFHDAHCVVNKGTGTVTHLSIDGHVDPPPVFEWLRRLSPVQ